VYPTTIGPEHRAKGGRASAPLLGRLPSSPATIGNVTRPGRMPVFAPASSCGRQQPGGLDQGDARSAAQG